jgi:glycosyltransferase involved in cell wall biosynthesis
MTPIISVVIPTFNRRETLETVLPLLAKQSLPPEQYELLLCDSGSSDGTAELVAALAIPNLRHILPPENRGRSGARNVGIRAAAGEIVLFTDADIIPSPNLLEEHLRLHRAHPHSSVVGLEVQVDTVAEYEQVRDNPYDKGRHMHGRTDKEMSWLFFLTGNASAPRQALLDVGLFDENFTVYGHEDLELGYRLQQAGYTIRYNAAAVNYHWHPVPFEERCDKMRHSGVATKRFYDKHRDGSILLRLGVNPVTLILHAVISVFPAWQAKLRSKKMQKGWGRELTLQYYYLCGYRGTQP